ncbi:MAG TPA: MFS transporter [Caulobacteraceae bacterium]|nr:MFS transporter [Caulobacteraceae bacterium]
MSVPATGQRPRLGLPTKLAYGLGSVAFGVKDAGFQTFLLLFYNQLVGLPSEWVSGAIALALIVDAGVDPIVGQISDHWRSRWGRRHPFMYAAALPVAVSYLLLWNPPHASHAVLFVYLLLTAVVVRTFITFYEIPSSALVAELTQNYDQRTTLLSFRSVFGNLGGLGMVLAAYLVFLRPTPAYPQGQLNPHGYAAYGIASAVVMLVTILLSAAGTQRFVPFLHRPVEAPKRASKMVREMIATLSNRSFLMTLGAGSFAAMAGGLHSALTLYFATFYWELTSAQISLLVVMGAGGALAGSVLAPYAARRMGKKAAALTSFAITIPAAVSPFVLRAAGLFPANHSTWLLPALLVFIGVVGAISVAASILISSMVADVVEDSQVTTGRRSEGLFFAASAFTGKLVSAGGLFFAGLILGMVAFPIGARPGAVDSHILTRLVWTYIPIYAGLSLVAFGFLCFYDISRHRHEENLRRAALASTAGLPAPG